MTNPTTTLPAEWRSVHGAHRVHYYRPGRERSACSNWDREGEIVDAFARNGALGWARCKRCEASAHRDAETVDS